MTIEDIKAKLKTQLSEKRFVHSVNVMETSVKLAERYGADACKAALAGLLHDCARDIRGEEAINLCAVYGIEVDEICRMQPELLHGRLGEKLAQELYGIEDRQILKAIAVHTMGLENMDLLCKIVFIADYIEPARMFPAVEELRRLAFTDLDAALLAAVNSTINYVLSTGRMLHPDTVNTRNWIIKELEKGGHHETKKK